MIKKLQKFIGLALVVLLSFGNIGAQDDCGCENFEGEPVCVDFFGEVIQIENECLAECWGLEIVEGECEAYEEGDCDSIGGDWGGEWGDCDCEEDVTNNIGVCYTFYDEFFQDTIIGWAPNECFIGCFGIEEYAIVDCEEDWGDDWEDEWTDCDCEEEITDSTGLCFVYIDEFSLDTLTGWAPNECFIGCFGITEFELVDCDSIWGEDWEDDDWGDDWSDCDCEEEITDSIGVCFSYFDEFLQDTSIGWAPNECFISCFGIEEYEIVDCDYEWEDEWEDDWSDCECEEEITDSTGVCFSYFDEFFQDTLVSWAPNECFITCYGIDDYEIVDCDYEWEDEWEDDWSDCECEEEVSDSTGVCFSYFDEFFQDTVVSWAPNECFIECFGIEGYAIVDCENEWDGEWEDDDEWGELDSCFLTVDLDELTTIQAILLSLSENCDLELPDCILDAPIFETDEEFILYIEENCDEDFGGGLIDNIGSLIDNNDEPENDEALTPGTMELSVKSNPGTGEIFYTVESTFEGNAQVIMTDLNGNIISSTSKYLEKGANQGSLNAFGLLNNIYILSISNSKERVHNKFFVK